MKTPRDYQLAARHATFGWFAANPVGNPLIAMPTGSGKALVIADTIRHMLTTCDPSHRFLMLTDSAELVQQNCEELAAYMPECPLGVHAAELGRRDLHHQVVFGTRDSAMATIRKSPSAFGARHTLLIDEAHMVSPKDTTSYAKIVAALRATNINLRAIGYTATPYRLGQGLLTDGKNPLFSAFAFDITGHESIGHLVRLGHLAPLVARGTDARIDVSGVRVKGGEFNLQDLQRASNVHATTRAAVAEIVETMVAQSRRCALVYCAGIEHVESTCEAFEALGIDARMAHSKRTPAQNREAIAAFRDDQVSVLVNGNMLVKGFNVPQVDLIACLRATMSVALHVQMLGRGTRPAPGKRDCLVLDFAGNIRRLGPIDDPIPPRRPGDKSRPGVAPVKECPHCRVLNHTSVRACVACGTEFSRSAPHQTTAFGDAPMRSTGEQSEDIGCKTLAVSEVYYGQIETKSGRPALKCLYVCGRERISEIVCFEHPGYAGFKAREWWRNHVGGYAVPPSVAAALARKAEFKQPISLTIADDGAKWPEIRRVTYGT